jgi:hypothetical protein
MVSESLHDSLGPLLSGFRYRAISTIYIHAPSPIVLGVRGVLRSLTSDVSWHGQLFIRDNHHFTSWFCKNKFDPIFNYKNFEHGYPYWRLFGYKYSCFCIQVAKLRQRFYNSVAPGGLAGDRSGAVSATGFSISAQEIWKAIRQNKDLDLPAHKVFNNIISRCNTGLTS